MTVLTAAHLRTRSRLQLSTPARPAAAL